ncbi:MAG: hypothetical protein QXH30_01360 [Candidatus Bilamarchaeaceae archaeon]
MAEKSGLGKAISYVGIAVGAIGIMITIFFFFIFNGLLDGIHSASLAQVDSAIAVMRDVGIIVEGTANSVDSFNAFAQNASGAMGDAADAVGGMGDAMNALAIGVSAIPMMPEEVSGVLKESAKQIGETAESMQGASSSMEGVSGNALSTAMGIQQLKEDVQASIASLEQTKKQINEIYNSAKLALILGAALISLAFALIALSFYRQLNE